MSLFGERLTPGTSSNFCKSVKTGGLDDETPVDRLLRIDTIGDVEEQES